MFLGYIIGNLTKVRTGLNSWTDLDYAVNTYHYDNLNRLITSMDNSGQSTSYGYDANSNLTKTIDRNNILTYYTYDGLNRVIKKKNSKDGEKNAIAYTYDLLGNCIRQLYSYDRADRVTSFQVKQGSVTEIDLTYSYQYEDSFSFIIDQQQIRYLIVDFIQRL